MAKLRLRSLLAGVATLASTNALAGGHIQDSPAAAAAIDADEIVVTVRKTEESLQDVPLSVTALPSVTLERATIQQLSDVANLTPGLSFQDFNVGALSTPVIRGLAQTNTQGRENNVGMFIDGIYLSGRNNLDLELLDLERVEVVKGPQSALYGRSTFAGTINYVTKAPSDELDVKVVGSVGSDEYYEGQLNVSGPITEGVSGTVAVAHREFDGATENIADSDNLGGYDNTSFMGKLLFEPTDALSITAKAFYTDEETDSAGISLEGLNCGSSAPTTFPPPGSPGGDPTYTCGTLPFEENVSVDPRATGGEADSTILTLDIVYDFGDVTLTSVTGYTDSSWEAITDYDASADGVPYAVTDGVNFGATNLATFFFNDSEDESFSQELRLDGGDDTLTWLAGLYYAKDEAENNAAVSIESVNLLPGETIVPGFLNVYATPTPLTPNFYATQSTSEVEIFALFGRVQWNINDRNRVSFEARYTNEEKENNGIAAFSGPPSGFQSDDWGYFAPRITYDFNLTDDIMLYASAARGTKSGGFNGAFGDGFPEEASYDEETNDTFEVGSKGTLADGRIRYDVALFYVDWDDLQISGASQDPLFIGSIVTNAGGAESKGIEIQIDGMVTDWLDIGGGYAYADPKFDNGVTDTSIAALCGDGSLCTTDVSGNQVGRTVKNQFNLYASFNSQLNSEWDWYARADYIYRDKSPTRSANLQFIDSYNLFNARVGVANKNWDVAVWAKNLFDEDYVTSQIRQPQLNNFESPTTVIQGSQRQVALTVTYRM